MKFFVLHNPAATRRREVTEYICAKPCNLGEAPECAACRDVIGVLEWLPPYRAQLKLWGGTFGDVVFGTGFKLLVSERFRTLWGDANLTGLDGFEPVEVTRVTRFGQGKKSRRRPPPYYCVSVARGRAAIDDARSGLEREDETTCPTCRLGREGIIKRTRRIVLERSTWSGEDVFIPRGLPGTYLASERFKRFCDQHKFANVLLIPAAEYGFDFYPDEGEK